MQSYFKSIFNFIQCQTSALKCITCFIYSFKHTESATLSSEICNKRGRASEVSTRAGLPEMSSAHISFLGMTARKLFFFF